MSVFLSAYGSAIAAFLLCLTLTPPIRYLALKNEWLANPTTERWHKKPTALLGGVAIYIGIAAPLFFIADFVSLVPSVLESPVRDRLPSIAAVIWIGVTLLFLLGLVDDFIRLKPYTKLIGQILVAATAVFFGFRLHWFTSLTLDTMITIVWIVGITNAFNLIDNMDGLCAGIGAIAGLIFVFLFNGYDPKTGQIAMIVCGALSAFLVYNFNPASIFMGDCGSLLIGFTLSMLGLYYSEKPGVSMMALYLVPVMVLMVPVMDTMMVTLIRVLSGRRASKGGKDHTSHRLVLMGFNEKSAVLLLYTAGTVSGLSAIFVSRSDTLTSPAVIIPVFVSVLLMGIYLAQIRVYPEKEFSLLRGKAYTPILVELTYKRQLLLVILDLGLIAFSYYLSYRLRFGSGEFPFYFKMFLKSLPVVIGFKLTAFFWLNVYRSFWGYTSTSDVAVYLKASTLATLLSLVAVTYIYRFENFSKGLFLIDWLITTALLLGTRGSFRIFLDVVKRRTLAGDAVLIYGAGRGGEILLREILNNKKHKFQPVGFIDDDKIKTGRKLQGYPVLGTLKDVERMYRKYRVNGVVISFNSNDEKKLKSVKIFCRQKKIFLKHFSIVLEDVDIENA